MEDEEVIPAGTGEKTNLVFVVIIDQGKFYTDLTGKYPVRSIKVKYCVMVCCPYDYNYTMPVPMKSKPAS